MRNTDDYSSPKMYSFQRNSRINIDLAPYASSNVDQVQELQWILIQGRETEMNSGVRSRYVKDFPFLFEWILLDYS